MASFDYFFQLPKSVRLLWLLLCALPLPADVVWTGYRTCIFFFPFDCLFFPPKYCVHQGQWSFSGCRPEQTGPVQRGLGGFDSASAMRRVAIPVPPREPTLLLFLPASFSLAAVRVQLPGKRELHWGWENGSYFQPAAPSPQPVPSPSPRATQPGPGAAPLSGSCAHTTALRVLGTETSNEGAASSSLLAQPKCGHGHRQILWLCGSNPARRPYVATWCYISFQKPFLLNSGVTYKRPVNHPPV